MIKRLKIADWLKAHGMTIMELAKRCEVTYSTAWHWVHGTRIPNLKHLLKIAQVFNCDVSKLYEK